MPRLRRVRDQTGLAGRRHECRRGTQECVRHNGFDKCGARTLACRVHTRVNALDQRVTAHPAIVPQRQRL